MRSIAFARIRRQVHGLLGDVLDMCGPAHPKPNAEWKQSLKDQMGRLSQDGQLRIAFIGEFSAGKSALISALTGAELTIGADVTTTQISESPWQGVVLVDTPGVQSQSSDIDHDRIAREATVHADLVLFVITNELFNDRLAAHLQYVIGAKGLRLAHKTAVVVNKMDRETNPDEVICSEVCKALGEHGDLPIWFCAAQRYLQSSKLTGPLQERFRRESRVEELIDHIDGFVKDRGLTGRITTPVQIMDDVLDAAEEALAESEEVRAEAELLRRQKRILTQLRASIGAMKQVWKHRVQTAVIKKADVALREVAADTDAEGLEKLIGQGLRDASTEVGTLHDGVTAELTSALDAAHLELEELGKSPLAQAVFKVESERSGHKSVDIDTSPAKSGTVAAKLMRDMVPALQNGLKQAAKDAKGMRDLVYGLGKGMGKKFRPWQATKAGEGLAKGAGRLSKALPFVAVAIDAWLNYREEKAEEQRQKHVATLRLAVRRAFSEQAEAEGAAVAAAIEKSADDAVSPAIAKIDQRMHSIAGSRQANADIAGRISDLKTRCSVLRSEIEHQVRPTSG